MPAVTYGNQTIAYELRYSQRKTLGIEVYPDMRVLVTAPEGTPDENIKTKLRTKARWILRQLRAFEKYQPLSTPKQFISGETHLYMGKEYILKVQKSDTESVKLRGRYFWVNARKPEKAEKLLTEWYREKASLHFLAIMDDIAPAFEQQLGTHDLIIRKMSTRWGSCTPGGTITLNLNLIKAPRRCIEYVILHELCHLVYHKHDKRFYQLLQSKMPSWKKWKERLELTLA